MKTWKGIIIVLFCCSIMIACGGKDASAPVGTTSDLSSEEQAQIVAAALSSDQGGIGKDIENITENANRGAQGSGTIQLSVAAEQNYYDASGHQQDSYDPATTDMIEYTSDIDGKLSTAFCFFQEVEIGNHTEFDVTGLTTDTATINGTNWNHSSYSRRPAFNNNQVDFNIDSEFSLRDLKVALDVIPIPYAGTIEGTITGSYERITIYNHITNDLNFHFTATYLGDNTAEIELSGDILFNLDLVSGVVTEID